MPHGCVGAALQVGDTADIGREDLRRRCGLQGSQFAVAQLCGQCGLQDAVGAGGSAAQVRVAAGELDIEAELAQLFFYPPAQLLAVLQGAGRVEDEFFGRKHGF